MMSVDLLKILRAEKYPHENDKMKRNEPAEKIINRFYRFYYFRIGDQNCQNRQDDYGEKFIFYLLA